MQVRPRRALTAGAALALALTAAPALAETATEDAFVPNTPTTEVFLQCSGPTKENFTNHMLNGQNGAATWGPEAPASVTTGAGCGKVDDPLFGGTRPETAYQHTLKGTYTGNVDTLTVTLYTGDLGQSRLTDGSTTLSVRATVDGVSLFGVTQNESATGTIVSSPADVPVTVIPVATGATGAVRALSFSITGIDLLLPEDDKQHTVVIDVADDFSPDAHTWLWGAAEAPSGVVFTPEAIAPAKLKAAKRSTRK